MATKLALFTTAAIILSDLSAAEPARPPAAQACAAFDVHILTLLEDHGRAATLPGRDLAGAMADLVAARAACARSDYDDALERYSRIGLSRPADLSLDLAEAR